MSTQAFRSSAGPILWFLGLVFAATWGVQYFQIQDGLRFDADQFTHTPAAWLLLITWIPGLTALLITTVTEKGSPRRVADRLLLRPGTAGPYFLTVLLVPLVYGVIHTVGWLAGFSQADPALAALNAFADTPQDLTSLFTVMLPASMLLGPLLQFVYALGEELGWRGFLLPRLMGLGKVPAYAILGVVWGLWHAPLILVGFNYPGHPISGVIMMCVVASALGVFINEMTLRSRSVVVAAFIHATVNAQVQGIWMWLFPETDPLLGGSFGLVAALIWLAAGLLCARAVARQETRDREYGRYDTSAS
ncbi:CPBP family intramembrane metalloprotease [Pseudodesulfovibrio sp. F-1]|uniref:CPBP family intramembrane metalloprotease n=1 Tax=Pseudodesulfovibrio alkaliphilus TaxID=2661613 RepID=A0A7K1KKG1_9BACT|nr:CPBP family intramembrane glutamic endopeptidase [Pseudodesulfovibrio alkaliphilus]MUM76382.1 CPBP family intramembrane metalloprotease [Pseudodesulfovibrio alkaliphilus]